MHFKDNWLRDIWALMKHYNELYSLYALHGEPNLKKRPYLHPMLRKCDLANKSITMYQQRSLPNK